MRDLDQVRRLMDHRPAEIDSLNRKEGNRAVSKVRLAESSHGRSMNRVLRLAACGACIVKLLAPMVAIAHGSIAVPLSRVMQCRFADNPENPSGAACAAAVAFNGGSQFLYDWNGIRQGQADGQHQQFVADGSLCAGGSANFAGLDLARDDWVATSIEPDEDGNFEFIYQATAQHATLNMQFFVTKPGWDSSRPLAWDDLDFVEDPAAPSVIDPFCQFDSAMAEDYPGVPDQVYRMNCPLPARTGRHVIYNVWQRSDSPEAFYACIDVVMGTEAEDSLFADGFESGSTEAWSNSD